MHEKLNSKRYLRLVRTTQASPLTLNERLVYSALLTDSDGLTQNGISAITGLDAKSTVAAALNGLAGHGLARQPTRRWAAWEPQDEQVKWFSFGIKDEDWRRRFDHVKLYQRSPACPLPLRQNVVYSLLQSLARNSAKREDLKPAHRGRVCDGLTYEYLAMLSGVGDKTVTKTIDFLADSKLVRSFPSTSHSRFALVLLEPTDVVLAWYVDKQAEAYPGLIEFLDAREVDLSDASHEGASPVAVAEPIPDEGVGHRKAAKRAKTHAVKSTPQVEPEHQPEEPLARPEPEVLPPVPDARLDPPDPIELSRLKAAEDRRRQEENIESILLGYGYDAGAATKLCKEFDKPGLPAYDAYKSMIYDVEETFRRNRSEGRYPKVRTSERLLVRRLEVHRTEAMERHERNLQAHDRRMLSQRISLVGRTALERPWADYNDPLTAPFDARLFVERVGSSELAWDSWGRHYGEEACRRALVGLPRAKIDEVLVEDGRMEPDEFVERLTATAPPKPSPRRMTDMEMYEAWKTEVEAA